MSNNQLTLDEIKKVELSVLCKIHEICENEQINYSLAYGTLLGAIRHKGFIPWDDDIDILMPRDDYEKFIRYCTEHNTPFYIISNRSDSTWPFMYTRVCDENTVIPDEPLWRWRGEMGLFVDIVAIDGWGNTYGEAGRILRSSVFKLSLANASNWKQFFKTRIRFKWYYDPIRYVFYILGKVVNGNSMIGSVERKLAEIPMHSVKYSGAIGTAVSYGKREIMDSSVYTEFTYVSFEGKKFKAFKEYDKILSQLYGDYMTPPPKEQQIGHHYIEAYWG